MAKKKRGNQGVTSPAAASKMMVEYMANANPTLRDHLVGTGAIAAPPAAPAKIDPFWNAQDLAAINDFVTNFSGQLANIDFELGNLKTDTSYQKGQTNTKAKEETSLGADAMAARGLFRSSIKDAALYDIEATRALSTKFLDDKLNASILKAGTDKTLLADSKKRFDEAMLQKKTENAQGPNDANSAAWADAMAAWVPKATPLPKAPAAPKPAAAPRAPVQSPQTSHRPGGDSTYGGDSGWGKPGGKNKKKMGSAKQSGSGLG